MKPGWEVKKLGELCEIELGRTPSRSDSSLWDPERETGNVWLSIADLLRADDGVVSDSKEYVSENGAKVCKLVLKGTLLVSFKLTLGRLAFAGRDLFTNEAIAALTIRNENEITKNYLFYVLHFFDWIKAAENDVKLKGMTLNKAKLKEIEVGFPKLLAEQQRIVAFLDEAFAGIATAKAHAERNLQNARALFESHLNAAMRGDLTKEWRRSNKDLTTASEGLNEALGQRHHKVGNYAAPRELRPPVFLKEIVIPKEWTLASPEQLSISIVDCPHSTPKWADSGIVCLRTTNFSPGKLNLDSVRFVSEDTYRKRIERLEPKPGDVVYSREGGILGIACMIPDGLQTCLGQRMMLFRLDMSIVTPEYFTFAMNSDLILAEVRRLTGGAASPHLNVGDIRRFPIPLPTIAEQREIMSILESVSSETQRLESIYQRKIAALDELKQSLLHEAFSMEE